MTVREQIEVLVRQAEENGRSVLVCLDLGNWKTAAGLCEESVALMKAARGLCEQPGRQKKTKETKREARKSQRLVTSSPTSD